LKKPLNYILLIIAMFLLSAELSGTNGVLFNIVICMAVSFVIFMLGATRYRLSNLVNIILLAANILFFVFMRKHNVYFFNVIIIAYIIWSYITPHIAKFKNIFNISFLISCLAAYVFSLMRVNLFFMILILYPIYLSGYMTKDFNFEKSRKQLVYLIINILFSMSGLIILLSTIKSLTIAKNIRLLDFFGMGPKILAYVPFAIVFYLWASICINILIYIYSDIYSDILKTKLETNSEINFTSNVTKNAMIALISFFSIICGLLLMSNYALSGEIGKAFKNLLDHNIIVNGMFLASLYLVLMCLIGKGLSVLVLTIITFILTVANYIKMTYMNEPFYPWDVYYLRDLFLIGGDYISLRLIIIVASVVAVLVFLIIKFRKQIKSFLKFRPHIKFLPMTASILTVNLIVLNVSYFSYGLNMGRSWYIGKDELLKNGMMVQTLYNLEQLKTYLPEREKDYSYDKMVEINEKYKLEDSEGTENSVKPNIVVIMSESFWDPSQFDNVKFDKVLAETVNKYKKGELISPIFGGGTANTEFEVLTGLTNYFLCPGVIPYNAYLRRDTISIASVLKDNGYETIAIHPNVASFYNRNKVYDYFGFDTFLDYYKFNLKEDFKGPHISDEKFIDKVIDTLNNNTGKPKFVFGISIQNHDPYYDLYDSFDVKVESDKLDKVETNILTNFSQNIYDADRTFKKLIEAIEQTDTPTMVYFFGDHLPRLGHPKGNMHLYDKLGYFENIDAAESDAKLYTTPIAIWSNFKEVEEISTAISPAQLSYQILKDSNAEIPGYFYIFNELIEKYPVLQNRIGINVDTNDELIKDYRMIQYDILFGKQYLKKINSSTN